MKYIVKLKTIRTWYYSEEIEANSEEALEKAKERFEWEENDFDGYSTCEVESVEESED